LLVLLHDEWKSERSFADLKAPKWRPPISELGNHLKRLSVSLKQFEGMIIGFVSGFLSIRAPWSKEWGERNILLICDMKRLCLISLLSNQMIFEILLTMGSPWLRGQRHLTTNQDLRL